MTGDLDRERAHLILADRHLVAGEQRVAGQIALIQRITEHGRDSTTARDLLRLLEETMVLWQDHRRLILDAIARHERVIPTSPQADPGQTVPRPWLALPAGAAGADPVQRRSGPSPRRDAGPAPASA
ncbi:hypothetical protein [Microvirga sp. M2]|uniref:hypothetical protein n=1 Tax=Microvirga sp. M2 TaxID=3073270 RepID=UPI0039C45D59